MDFDPSLLINKFCSGIANIARLTSFLSLGNTVNTLRPILP